MTIGNKVLIETHGFGVKVLAEPLRKGHIEVYDHDVSKIKLGSPQEKYYNARLWIDESAKEDDVRFAVRNGGWSAFDRRFNVNLGYGLRNSDPAVAGLGFRPEGNQAYVNTNKLLEELSAAEESIKKVIGML